MIRKLEHYAYEFWRQEINIDSEGNAVHYVDARIVNIGKKLLKELYFPIYCDAKNVSEAEIKPWAKSGWRKLKIVVENWLPERARGKVRLIIEPPVAPSEARRIKWGYTLPRTFKPGDEYYNWDVSTLHYEIGGRLIWDKSWKIIYARWDEEIGVSAKEPNVSGSEIHWVVQFPEKGKRLKMLIGLSQEHKSRNS